MTNEIVPGVDFAPEVSNVPNAEAIDNIVENIVSKWNELVDVVQNTTIGLCLMIREMVKQYPEESVKEILQKVRAHPNIKRFVSVDRIWQGLRLMRQRPELIEYQRLPPQEKESLPEEEKPYLKKDGEIFWEFYFELAKQPLNEGVITLLERQGKEEKWTYRELKNKIQSAKDEIVDGGAFENKQKEKFELIRGIAGMLKSMQVDNIRKVNTYCKELTEKQIEAKP
jgi:hypothetical protein